MRCSFASEESCSAYGLRIARTHSWREAIPRIVRRLHRCGDACLLSDGTRLGWRELHDAPPGDIARQMRADGEGGLVIARMLRTRLAVARWRGERAAIAACHAFARMQQPRVISLGAVNRRARVRLAVFASVATVGAVLAGVVPWVALPLLVGGAALLVGGARRIAQRTSRFAATSLPAPRAA